MIRLQFVRIALVALTLSLCTSFVVADPPTHGPALETQSEAYRVSRHYASGLEYLLMEPRDLPEDAELPMIVYLHGRSSVPTAPRDAFYDLETPVRIIMPRGPDRSGFGYAWMPVSARHGERPELVGPLVERAGMIAEAMVEWRRRHPTRGLPIVVGFSQGGMLAMELAVNHPAAVAEAIPLAGWLPPSRMPRARLDPYASTVPIHALHGASDPVLDARRSEATVERLHGLGYPAELETVAGAGHEVTADMRDRARTLLQNALSRLPEDTRSAGHS